MPGTVATSGIGAADESTRPFVAVRAAVRATQPFALDGGVVPARRCCCQRASQGAGWLIACWPPQLSAWAAVTVTVVRGRGELVPLGQFGAADRPTSVSLAL